MNKQTTLIANKTKKSPKYTFITQSDYDSVKMLQKHGMRVTDACKITKRSNITIHKIYKSTSLKEYKLLSSYKKPKEVAPEPEVEQTPVDLTTPEEIVQLLSTINDRLSHIEKLLTRPTENRQTKQWFPVRKSD